MALMFSSLAPLTCVSAHIFDKPLAISDGVSLAVKISPMFVILSVCRQCVEAALWTTLHKASLSRECANRYAPCAKGSGGRTAALSVWHGF
jgi:hypothetical protein